EPEHVMPFGAHGAPVSTYGESLRLPPPASAVQYVSGKLMSSVASFDGPTVASAAPSWFGSTSMVTSAPESSPVCASSSDEPFPLPHARRKHDTPAMARATPILVVKDTQFSSGSEAAALLAAPVAAGMTMTSSSWSSVFLRVSKWVF